MEERSTGDLAGVDAAEAPNAVARRSIVTGGAAASRPQAQTRWQQIFKDVDIRSNLASI